MGTSSDDALAGDLLFGAPAIAEYLTGLGRPTDTTGVYYLRRAGDWPIGADGSRLIASKKRLTRHLEKITS
jgi:hypothetical protein